MDYSSPLLLSARNFGRKLGVLRPLQRMIRKLRGDGYEESFERALLTGISAGDIVWDIGANVGLYTRKFSELAGPHGKIVAFEPGPQTFVTLRANVAGCANVVCQQVALSDFTGEADFHITSEENSPVNGLARRDGIPVSSVQIVKVSTGDAFVTSNPQLAPNKLKIDVEGFEYEVLKGMETTLRSPSLRGVFIEVHFTSLAERGLADAPRQMIEQLKKAGFSVRWTDASHLEAMR